MENRRIGALGESRFISKCLEQGYMPCMPFYPAPYDFVLVTDERSYKVQIKTTNRKPDDHGRYEFMIASGLKKKKAYNRYNIDIIVCYILHSDDYYILFRQQFEGKKRINIYENGKTFGEFKNKLSEL